MENISTFINTVIALLALFISLITAYFQFFRKPKLKLFFEDKEPYKKYLNTPYSSAGLAFEFFVRVQVSNENKIIAKNCFGKVTEWYVEGEKVVEFDPIKLHWVSNEPTDYSAINLNYKEYDYLDIVFTKIDESELHVYTNTHQRGTPTSFSLYKENIVKVVVYCENGESDTMIFLI